MRRLDRGWSLLLLLLIVSALAGCPGMDTANVVPTELAPIATEVATRWAPIPAGTEVAGQEEPDARVVRVIDGDTIVVDIDGQEYRLRYIGMDAPEDTREREPYGAEATAKNRELVEGKTVRLEKDVSETDRFGRLLRYVYVDGVMVNAELVRLGYAQVVSYPPDVKHHEEFLRLQREAREADLGLWGLDSDS